MTLQKDTDSIKFLHFSDLHFGLSQQDWMWPTFKTQLLEDLTGLHERTGPWDLVIFSGDLTQKGSVAEYLALTDALSEIWKHMHNLGSDPALFVVPGNHDLSRPDPLDPQARVFNNWWSETEVQSDFWGSQLSNYRGATKGWFKNYSDWHNALSERLPVIPVTNGILPGDVSAVFTKGSNRLGIVGLNSAWLQITNGDFEGKLCVHPRQLMAVTDNDPDGWCKKNDGNLLVTHHPSDWLHPDALRLWSSEVNTPRRFDAHLYGHMHKGASKIIALSGATARLSIQATSLFGLEKFGTKHEERDHGYAVIHLSGRLSSRCLRIWPRKLTGRKDGSRRLCADLDWDLINDSYCEYSLDGYTGIPPQSTEPMGASLLGGTYSKNVLSHLIRPGAFVRAHSVVRKAEQSVFLAALQESRMAWLVTDWGLGGNEFIESVRQQLAEGGDIHYLDLHQYLTKDEFLAGMPEKLGCSFERLCTDLAEVGPAFLVLDDVVVDNIDGAATLPENIDQQIPGLVQVILDYCPKLRVIVRSRVNPLVSQLRVVQLRPLDEADTGQYIYTHENGGAHLKAHDTVERLHRHTDGMPYRLDSALRDIQIVGLKGLHELDLDVVGSLGAPHKLDFPLSKAILDLSESKDSALSRAFSLLQVLSLFPQGAQLSRVKRIHSHLLFSPSHASILRDRALLDSFDVESIGDGSSLIQDGKSLMVRRPVREYIIQSLSSEEHLALSNKVLKLYFGDDWGIHGIRPNTGIKFNDARCEAREIGNATTMVLRFAKGAVDSENIKTMTTAVALATAYAAQLRSGGHFRSVASLYDELLPLFELYAEQIDLLLAKQQYAGALRMIDETEKARELFRQRSFA